MFINYKYIHDFTDTITFDDEEKMEIFVNELQDYIFMSIQSYPDRSLKNKQLFPKFEKTFHFST